MYLHFHYAAVCLHFLFLIFSRQKYLWEIRDLLLIGVVNAILVLKFIDPGNGPESVNPIISSPAIGFTILMIPLLDTLRVFAIRIFKRRSPFSPDRNHIHHLLSGSRSFSPYDYPFAGSYQCQYGCVCLYGKITGLHHPDFIRYCTFLLLYSNCLLFQTASFHSMGNRWN